MTLDLITALATIMGAIATIVGVAISTYALYNAWNTYKMGKRDNFVKEIRNVLTTFEYNCKSLDQLVNYEISHELIMHVISSTQMDRILTKIYTTNFNSSTTKEMLNKNIENFPQITTSIHTELLSQYEGILQKNKQDASKIYANYPSLYRVYLVANIIFSSVINELKNTIRNEEINASIIKKLFERKDQIQNLEDFKTDFFYTMMGVIHNAVLKEWQRDINDIKMILKMTTYNYMGLNDDNLLKQKEQENKIIFKEIDKTDIFEDLHEAEKGLKLIFTEAELLEFHGITERIKERNKPKDD